MKTWTHLERLTKINWRTLSDASSSCQTWQNLSASSSIERIRLNNDDSRTDIQSEALIEDEGAHPTVVLEILYQLHVLRQKISFLHVSSKINYLEDSILDYFVFFFF